MHACDYTIDPQWILITYFTIFESHIECYHSLSIFIQIQWINMTQIQTKRKKNAKKKCVLTPNFFDLFYASSRAID